MPACIHVWSTSWDRTTINAGAGGDPEQGRKAAEESVEELREALTGADMVRAKLTLSAAYGRMFRVCVSETFRQDDIIQCLYICCTSLCP